MDSEYTPDRWILIHFKTPSFEAVKILSSYYGGYLGCDSWRLSSGVTKIIDKDKFYEIHNHSGSIYTCYKSAEGVSGYSGGILHSWMQQAEERDYLLRTITVEEYEKLES